MSSDSESDTAVNFRQESDGPKRRRISRACDACRKRKTRCNRAGLQNETRCSNCATNNLECTYVLAVKRRGPLKAYVDTLESRLEKMEGLLGRLLPPDGDPSQAQDLGNLNVPGSSRPRSLLDTSSLAKTALHQMSPASGPTSNSPVDPEAVMVQDDTSDDENSDERLLTERLNDMRLNSEVFHRFLGKSSGASLVRTTYILKARHTGSQPQGKGSGMRRQKYWEPISWERSAFDPWLHPWDFPSPDLLDSLVNLYFDNINIFTALLHRPTFSQALADGLHLSDGGFRQVLLLVCATASRYSTDPAVLLDGVDDWHSAGWRWFRQVDLTRLPLLVAPNLYDLQVHCLAILFLQCSSIPQTCWALVGTAVRMALDVGAHRRKVYHTHPTVEDELWKRAFWNLVALDRLTSSGLGRPCALHEEDFDLDMPVECDDEYWTSPDPDQVFQQPAGKPSTVCYLTLYLKLVQIHAYALRTIYLINKSKAQLGFVGPQWEQHIVSRLDSALNKWLDSVPEFLRWDPTREDTTFLTQSAMLYLNFYNLQITIHRPFITSIRGASPLSSSSLAVCTSAARSCIRIMDSARRKDISTMSAFFPVPAFAAALVLLLNIWSAKLAGFSFDLTKEIGDVHKAMQAIKSYEDRFYVAGKLWDVLCELVSVGDLPLPPPPLSHKRSRDIHSSGPPLEPLSSSSSGGYPLNSSASPEDGPRQYAGTRRAQQKRQNAVASSSSSQNGLTIDQQYHSRPQSASSSLGIPPPHNPDIHDPSSFSPLSFTSEPRQISTLPMHNDDVAQLSNYHDGQRYLHTDTEPQFSFDFAAPFVPAGSGWGTMPAISVNGEQSTSEVGMGETGNGFDTNDLFTLDTILGNSVSSSSQPQSQHQHRHGPQVGDNGGVGMEGQGHAYATAGMPLDSDGGMPMRMGEVDGNDFMSMWTNVPSGFEGEDWDAYISNMLGMNQVPGAGSGGGDEGSEGLYTHDTAS